MPSGGTITAQSICPTRVRALRAADLLKRAGMGDMFGLMGRLAISAAAVDPTARSDWARRDPRLGLPFRGAVLDDPSMWRGMTHSEIEDFWCTASPPVEAVYFEDSTGFSNFIVLMKNGAVTAQLDSAGKATVEDLRNALLYFLT